MENSNKSNNNKLPAITNSDCTPKNFMVAVHEMCEDIHGPAYTQNQINEEVVRVLDNPEYLTNMLIGIFCNDHAYDPNVHTLVTPYAYRVKLKELAEQLAHEIESSYVAASVQMSAFIDETNR